MKGKLLLTVGMIVSFLLFSTTMGFGAQWILDSKSGKLPTDLAVLVQQSGGTLVKSFDEVGIAVAEFSSESAAEALVGHGFNVAEDYMISWHLPDANYEHIGSNEPYSVYQWHLPVIEAPAAWDAGYTGAGVRVAVVDSGIYYYHPDLNERIDHAASTSFVPSEPDYMDYNGHGTHVAGIIAASDNDYGSIGIAPNATLIAVKVTSYSGVGYFSWFLNGIIHAVNQDADIINMSLGNNFVKGGKHVAALKNTVEKVIHWANKQGSLVVVSAGNDSFDMDHDGTTVVLPSESPHAVSVGATGPLGLTDFYRLASYSNYGSSVIFVTAPGGDYANYPAPGWYLDMVFSTTPGGWSWMAGTSQSAPMVSAVAALILEKYGPISIAQLKAKLKKATDDLGKNGKDPIYGFGHINARKAVTQ